MKKGKNYKKIVLCGYKQTGKSTYANYLLTDKYQTEYTPTMGVEVHPITYEGVTYQLWSTAGDPRYEGLRDGYYISSDGFLIFCDTEKNTNKYLKDILTVGLIDPKTPIVLIWPKNDLINVPNWLTELADNRNLSLVSISTKNKTNLYTPLALLAKK